MPVMPDPLRVGVVGFGKMGLLHASIANGLEISELVAAADPTAGVLESLKRLKPKLAIYDDFQPMLAEQRLDAVFIASPTHLHTSMALACVEAGVPFLVEKPLSPRVVDAVPLVAALRRTPVANVVGYMARYIDTFRKAREIVVSGALGQLRHFESTMYVSQLFKPGQGWRYDPRSSGGGVLMTQNSHLVDLLLWFFGPVQRVTGHVKRVYSEQVDDFAHAVFEFKSGLSGYMDTSWSVRHHRTVDLSILVHGQNGTLEVNDDDVRLFIDEARPPYSAGWTVWRKPDLFEGVSLDVGGPEYTRQDEEFLRAAAAKGQVASDVESAVRVQQVIEAIYQSSAEHRAVSIEAAA
jgi:predicted dehydrogenase